MNKYIKNSIILTVLFAQLFVPISRAFAALADEFPTLEVSSVEATGNSATVTVRVGIATTAHIPQKDLAVPEFAAITEDGKTLKDGINGGEPADRALIIKAFKKLIGMYPYDESIIGSVDILEGNGINWEPDSVVEVDGVFIEIATDGEFDEIEDTIYFELNPFLLDQGVRINTGAQLDTNTNYFVRAVLQERLNNNEIASAPVAFRTLATLTEEDENRDDDASFETPTEFDEFEPAKGETPNCGFFGTSSVAGCVAQVLTVLLYQPVLYFLSLAGEVLDFFLAYSIDDDTYRSDFITKGWGVTRDVSNILFIFILLYIAIGTVLGLQGVDAKKMIGKIVLVALLINFSLFFARVIVDTSNILAYLFYNGIEVQNTEGQEVVGAAGKKAITVAIADKLEVQTLTSGWENGMTVVDSKTGRTKPLGGTEYAAFYILVILLVVATAGVALYVFLSMSFLLVGRVVGIWISMILAPIAFISQVLPGDIKIPGLGFKDWMRDLLGLAFFVPVFFFFLYLIVRFVQTDFLENVFGTSSTDGTAIDTMRRMMSIVLPFAVIIALLLKAKNLSKDLAGKTAGMIMDGMAKIGGLAAGGAIGGIAIAGSRVGGLAGRALTRSENLKDAAVNGGAVSKFMAKTALKGGEKMQTGSWDARNTMAGKGLSKMANVDLDQSPLKMVGMDTKSTKGGLRAAEERNKKEEEEFKKLISGSSKADSKEYKQAKAEADLKAKIYDTQITEIDKDLKDVANTLSDLEKKKSDINIQIEEARAKGDIQKSSDLQSEKAEVEKKIDTQQQKQTTLKENKSRVEEDKKKVVQKAESIGGVDRAKARVQKYAENIEKRSVLGDIRRSLADRDALRAGAGGAVLGSVIPGVGTIAGGLSAYLATAAAKTAIRQQYLNKDMAKAVRKEKSQEEKDLESLAKKIKDMNKKEEGGDGEKKEEKKNDK